MPHAANTQSATDRPASRGTRLAVWLAIGLTSALCFGPLLLHEALPLADQSDVAFAAQFAQGAADSLRDGVIYPRWVGDANRGYGAPVFVFYSPLAYVLVAWNALVLGDALLALRVAGALLGLLAGASFYLATRGRYSPLGAAAGAVLYVAFPYHLLDLYTRFAFAEFAAFVWFPPLFVLAGRLVERFTWPRWYGLVAAASGLLLTHAVSAYLAAAALIPYVAVRLVAARRLGPLVPLAAAAAAVVPVCAVYLAPVVAERDAVHLERFLTSVRFDWRRNFLFRDEVALGYAPVSIRPHAERAAATQMLPALAAVGLLVVARRRRRGRDRATPIAHDADWIALAAVALATLALQTPISTPLWRLLPGMAMVGFPWRFAALQALASCLLVAAAISVSDGSRARRRAVLALVALASLPALAVGAMHPATVEFSLDPARARTAWWRTMPILEYVPAEVDLEHPRNRRLLERSDGSGARAVLAGGGEVDVRRWTDHRRQVIVEGEQADRLRLRTFAYPGWTLSIDGEARPFEVSDPRRAIEVEVPAGRHDVQLVFRPTPARRVGAGVSVLALLAAVGHLALRRGRGRAAAP